tara:strand:+ start:296 stop:976 length:681 start_codon:yes stop_codon:yes gene_type:complete
MPRQKKQKFDFNSFKTPAQKQYVPPYIIQNVVSTNSLGAEKMDLRDIALNHKLCEYNPQTFAAATIRILNPRSTALVFASGNMVVTGCKSTTESRLAARKYTRIYQTLGIPVMFRKFKIQNIVASSAAGFPIKLQDIANAYGPYVTFTPDLFPGLIFRSINPKLVFLIFRSGKVVITGARNVRDIKHTFNSLYLNILVRFKDNENSATSSSEYRNQLRNNRDTSDL